MSSSLTERLNKILPLVTSEAFLSSEGIGNEIAFYIFDYPAQDELQVREHIDLMKKHLSSHYSSIDVLHLNLLDVVIEYLKHRKLLDRALEMQAAKGDAAMLKALKGPLAAEKIRDFIAAEHRPADRDLLLLSGVGSVWPMLRAHSLLNCMHKVMHQTPLVMFYPGSYDGTKLRLFGQIDVSASRPGKDPYYRAFRLIAEETDA